MKFTRQCKILNRPEFKSAIESINNIGAKSRRNCPATYYIPILAMSATFTIVDQQKFNCLIGRLPTMAIWGDMSRRSILLQVTVAGDPLNSFSKDWIAIATRQPTNQSLVYSNSAATCKGAILNRLSAARTKLAMSNGKFLSLTGNCRMMLKSFSKFGACLVLQLQIVVYQQKLHGLVPYRSTSVLA